MDIVGLERNVQNQHCFVFVSSRRAHCCPSLGVKNIVFTILAQIIPSFNVNSIRPVRINTVCKISKFFKRNI